MVTNHFFEFLSRSDKFEDVEICFEGEVCKAHKAILYDRSLFFREILEKDPTTTRIVLDEDTRSTKFLGCWVQLREMMSAIYQGSIIRFCGSCSQDLVFAIKNYDVGAATGTPILQEVATGHFRARLVWLREIKKKPDGVGELDEVSGVLTVVIPTIYNRNRVGKFPLNDPELRKEFFEIAFRMILEYGDANELEKALKAVPDFAVDFSMFLAKKHSHRTE